MILLFVILARQAGLYKSLDVNATSIVGSFFLLPVPHLLLGVAWTLVYEMYFYYVFAAWLKASNRKVALLCTAGTLLALMVVARTVALPSSINQYLSSPIVLEFIFGMAIAYCYRQRQLFSGASVPATIVAALVMLWSTLHFSSSDTAGLQPDIRWAAWGLPSALIVMSLLWVRPATTATRRVFLKLGDASFAIYLSHAVVMTVYARLLKTDSFAHAFNPLTMTVFTIIFSLVLGFFVHIGIEQPLSRFFRGGKAGPLMFQR